ncbi:ribonuclease J [Spiroplasma turonicum]|uniref:Metallo-beta-lactamase superfamily hydrolase n=1 Tax=Spiroplasma turonicum TaxID=216946 RepID=A0A0K1P7H6_9MOLU|nr:ribonuclease J [Spiroplasma turonicum]AKU80139.1 metallo-beta-lactamase superfamily hydrolase [Spiroplasma turonicum]ALX71139.1 ribonuclease J [Spiroplasma turonicum]
MAEIKFMALGGQDERGKNLFIVSVDEQLFVFDSGMKFPERSVLGIDVIIPNFDFLKENAKKIKGIFISNPSSSNAGSISYILRDVDVPVYCNELTTIVLKYRNLKYRIKNRENNFKIIKDKDILKFDKNVSVEVFRTTSMFPESFGFAIHTKDGSIVYAGDYIMDGTEQSYFSTDMNHLAQISKKGVLTLISDSEFASRLGYTVPNHRIEKFIVGPMKNKKNRLVLGLFEEDVFKLFEIIAQAKQNDRKIAIYGKTIAKIIEAKTVQESLQLYEKDIITTEEFMNSTDGVLVITGAGDLLYSRLAKIAAGNDEVVEFTENDTIILATPPSAGVEKRHAEILDELARTNAHLIALSDKNIWTMRASYEDIKLMTRIMKPKSFIPVKGLYKDFLSAEKAAIEAGVKSENIELVKNGQVLKVFPDGKLVVSNQKIKTADIFVDGIGAGDIGAIVLNERKQLATDGAVIIGANLNDKTKELCSLIDIQMRGVVYIVDDNPIFKLMQKQIVDLITRAKDDWKLKPESFDINQIKKDIVSKVRSIIKQETGKQPIVLVIVNELSGINYEPKIRQKSNQ